MKDTMRSKLTQLVRRLEEIDQNLQDPDVTSNMDQFRALSKERAEIEPVVLKAKEYEQAEEDLAEYVVTGDTDFTALWGKKEYTVEFNNPQAIGSFTASSIRGILILLTAWVLSANG